MGSSEDGENKQERGQFVVIIVLMVKSLVVGSSVVGRPT